MSEFDNLIKKRAVALKYDSKNNRAPIIVASGMGIWRRELRKPPLRREYLYTRMIPWQSC